MAKTEYQQKIEEEKGAKGNGMRIAGMLCFLVALVMWALWALGLAGEFPGRVLGLAFTLSIASIFLGCLVIASEGRR